MLTFGQRVSAVEMTPDSAGFRIKERFARFVNVPELLTLWYVSADIKTAADLQLPTPELAERPDGLRQPETVLLARAGRGRGRSPGARGRFRRGRGHGAGRARPAPAGHRSQPRIPPREPLRVLR